MQDERHLPQNLQGRPERLVHDWQTRKMSHSKRSAQSLKGLPKAPDFLNIRWLRISLDMVVQSLPSSLAIALKDIEESKECSIT